MLTLSKIFKQNLWKEKNQAFQNKPAFKERKKSLQREIPNQHNGFAKEQQTYIAGPAVQHISLQPNL